MRGKPKLVKLTDRSGNLKSPYWYIQYFDAGRSKRLSTGCRLGAEDDAAWRRLTAFAQERERPTAREPDKLMVAQALKDYYDEHVRFLPSSEQAKYSEIKLNAFFGSMMVSHITSSKVNEYVREWQEKKHSNGTIRRDLQHLLAALNHEVREQRLIYAPKFKLPPPPAPRERTLSSEEINQLLEHCKTPHVKAFVQIMRYTGQRPGAVENLRWFQVDFAKKLIRFDIGSNASKRARSVPIDQRLMPLLKALHKEKKTEYVLEYNGEHAGKVRKSFERACDAAGLKGVSRYTLRHTFGTELYLNGVHEKTISDIMGHTTAKTTIKHYLKSDMDVMRDAVGAIGKQRRNSAKAKKKKYGNRK